jgi:acyl-CoA dehydrogenase
MGKEVDYSEYQDGRYMNYWEVDRTLQRELRRVYDDEDFEWAEPRLSEFGETVGYTIADNADYVDKHGPELHTHTKHGDIQNFVRYPAELHENETLAYEAGVVSDSFQAPPGRDENLPLTHYFGMLYLLSYGETAGMVCPVAMTAGAALVLEKFDTDGPLEEYYEALISRDHDSLIEGAMFLTEEQGGSDVGANETIAEYDEESGYWRLTGEKWFCSNIDGEGTLALARTEDAPEGTDGLSMFLVPHGDPDDGVMTKGDRKEFDGAPPPEAVNDQYYRRLKDKLGTTNVPTGEVELEDTKAYLVGDLEDGFKQMAEMLNLERLSNAAGACGIMGRALVESKVQAADREAFGKPINEFPLMREDLVDMVVDHEAATAYTFETARLFAEREAAERNGEDADWTYRLMRLLTPIAKLRTARLAIDTASYAMEIQGGNGYVDEFVTHRLLRDAQVLPIWEGTENILSLDVLRALEREDAHEPFMDVMQEKLDAITHPALADEAAIVESEYTDLTTAMGSLATEDADYAQLASKRLARYIYDVFTAALLLEEAQADLDGEGPSEGEDARTALVAKRFVQRHLEDQEARGITSGDRFPLEYFESIVNYRQVAPDELVESAEAD